MRGGVLKRKTDHRNKVSHMCSATCAQHIEVHVYVLQVALCLMIMGGSVIMNYPISEGSTYMNYDEITWHSLANHCSSWLIVSQQEGFE